MTSRCAFAPAVFLLGAFTASLLADTKLDLDRTTPVPENEPIPVMDFVRPPAFDSPRLNRGGTHVAATISAGDGHIQLLAEDLATQKFEYLVDPDNLDIRSFAWLDDKHLLFTGSFGGMFVAEPGFFRGAYQLLGYCGPKLVGVPEANRIRPLVWIRGDVEMRIQQQAGVFTLKSELHDPRPASFRPGLNEIDFPQLNREHIAAEYRPPAEGLPVEYFCDKDGELAFCITENEGTMVLHRRSDNAWAKCPVDLEANRYIDCGNRPDQFVTVAFNPPGTPSALRFMDAVTGAPREVLLQDPGYDFAGSLFRDPSSHQILGIEYDQAVPQVVWFNETYRTLQKTIDGMFPGEIVRIIDADRAGRRFILKTWSDRQPIAYHLLDLEKNSVGLLKNSRPWLDPKRMQPTSIMKFKTRDGQKLDAYVTLPGSASKKHPVPLVVWIEGYSLWQRNRLSFDPAAQFLASRGYAVLRVNHRWAEGYSWQFPREDEWAFNKMAQDINDATKTLLGSGVVDRGRVGIVGWQFGGYLGLSAIVDEPELYRCAGSVQGIFDLVKILKEWKYDRFDDPSYNRLVQKLGQPGKNKDRFAALSPAAQSDRIKIPVFVAEHKFARGESLGQTHDLISQLKARNIPCDELWLSRFGYGDDDIKTNVTLYARLEAFLAKYLAAASPAGTP